MKYGIEPASARQKSNFLETLAKPKRRRSQPERNKTEFDRRRRQERDGVNTKSRARYAKRKAAKRIKPILCARCGIAFNGKREDARYCSTRCRQKAHRLSRINSGFSANPLSTGNAGAICPGGAE
jgi:hypothetical protein